MYWFLAALKKYAVFTGRARRKEYWMFVLFSIIFGILAQLIDTVLGTGREVVLPMGISYTQGWVYYSFTLFLLIPSIAVSVRRLHDIGKSGWWYLWLNVIPPIVMLSLMFYIIIAFNLIPGIGGAAAANNFSLKGLALVLVIAFAITTIIALICCIVFIVWLATRGQQGPNKYGPDPLYPESEDTQL